MSAIMAIVGSALCVGSFWLLVSNVSGACSGVIGLAASIGFVVFSVLAADGWYKMLAGKIKLGKK